MKIYGYGEDALTLWALTTRAGEILSRLGDSTNPEEVLSLYRPSFGRGGNGQFGEFDAVLATPQAVYLIESKWKGSSEINSQGAVALREEQTKRHDTFRRRFAQWRKSPETGSDAFGEEEGLVMINAGSRLAANLHHVFGLLGASDRPLVDVLLYLRVSNDSRRLVLPPVGFKLVELRCETEGFIELGARLVES